jgi:hypothetical protein
MTSAAIGECPDHLQSWWIPCLWWKGWLQSRAERPGDGAPGKLPKTLAGHPPRREGRRVGEDGVWQPSTHAASHPTTHRRELRLSVPKRRAEAATILGDPVVTLVLLPSYPHIEAGHPQLPVYDRRRNFKN